MIYDVRTEKKKSFCMRRVHNTIIEEQVLNL